MASQASIGLAIRGGAVVTMDPLRTLLVADVLIGVDGRIVALADPADKMPSQRSIDARGLTVVPGLVQAHTHLCHTLFRGLAEDAPPSAWLREHVWPLEAAHDPDSMRAAGRLGIAELLLGGTTAILDMGTAHHTDALFEAASASAIRYTGGKALMDAGDGVPAGLLQPTVVALSESDRLADRWHEREGGRLRYALSPRCALHASYDLLRSIAARARTTGMLVQTHASETRDEADQVRERFGVSNIQLLANLGLTDTSACFAHCVWPEPDEFDVLASSEASVVHCPSSNMKLGSGMAPIAEYLDRGVSVALGADTAAANNRLDGWEELRLAGLMGKLRDGPAALAAVDLFEVATIGGARAIGLDVDIGSIEVGKFADLAVLDLQRAHAVGPEDVYTRLVYSARAGDVRLVTIGGNVVVDKGQLTAFSEAEAVTDADRQRSLLVARAFA